MVGGGSRLEVVRGAVMWCVVESRVLSCHGLSCHSHLQVAASGSHVFMEHSHRSGRLSESTCLQSVV